MDRAEAAVNHDPRENPARYLPVDRQSAALFLADWEDMVMGVVLRMRVKEPGEVLSRVFHRALRGLPDFRHESRLSTWLYRIAWREALRQAGKERRREAREAPLEAALSRPDGAEDQLRTLERREAAETVRAALGRLPARDREVLALRFLEELPHGVIAERLDIGESAARVRCHRALTRLRILLEDDHE